MLAVMAENDHENLLSILQAHGQQFMNSFSLPAPNDRKRKQKEEHTSHRSKITISDHDSDEEWLGFDAQEEQAGEVHEGDHEGDFENEDDDFVASTSSPPSNVVVFLDSVDCADTSVPLTKAQRKAFMSSKISKLREEESQVRVKEATDDTVDDRTSAQNDALLHRLVHTKLLSGSLNPELNMSSACRQKALAGRVLELSGAAKLGKGERAVRESERCKAAKHVREGIAEKHKEREMQQLEEAKNLGNYHPTIKKLFDLSSPPTRQNWKRDRGLKMGVGKFRGGTLRLSRDEISAVQSSSYDPINRGPRGRGRGRSAVRSTVRNSR